MKAEYIAVNAGVRYWEDADVNGAEDTDGTMIPFREGKMWKPVIRLSDGAFVDWPLGAVANIHYKVCDAGTYALLDENKQVVGAWTGDYVPNRFLCHGDNGYGDYIIMRVDAEGYIYDYRKPDIDPDEWEA